MSFFFHLLSLPLLFVSVPEWLHTRFASETDLRYVHPWVAASHLRWFISDFVIKRVLWVLTGTQAGCNQWAGELPPERQGRAYVFLNKSAKAMQFINQPYHSLSPLHRYFAHYIDPPLPPVGNARIDIVSFPTSFEGGKAVLPPPPKHRSKEVGWKEEVRPDLVVLCTGYRQDWSWLGEGYPKGPDECDVRGVASSQDKSIAFIGFLRPGVGTYFLRSPSPSGFASLPLSLSLSHSYLTAHDEKRGADKQERSPQWQKCKSNYSSSSLLSASKPQPRQKTIISSTPQLPGFNME